MLYLLFISTSIDQSMPMRYALSSNLLITLHSLKIAFNEKIIRFYAATLCSLQTTNKISLLLTKSLQLYALLPKIKEKLVQQESYFHGIFNNLHNYSWDYTGRTSSQPRDDLLWLTDRIKHTLSSIYSCNNILYSN